MLCVAGIVNKLYSKRRIQNDWAQAMMRKGTKTQTFTHNESAGEKPTQIESNSIRGVEKERERASLLSWIWVEWVYKWCNVSFLANSTRKYVASVRCVLYIHIHVQI